jgi:hypothetical protein
LEFVHLTLRLIVTVGFLGVGCILATDHEPAQAQAGDGSIGGEWKGTLDWLARQPVPSGIQYFSGHLDLALDEGKDGMLKGTLTGSETEKLEVAWCPSVTVLPGRDAAGLTGNFAQRKMTMSITDPTSTPPQMTPCPSGVQPGKGGPIFVFPHFNEALNSLTPVDKWNYGFDREWTVEVGRYPFTLHYTLKFQRIGIFPREAD